MCKDGRVQEAYELAKADLEQELSWAQREMGWVLYYLIKDDAETANFLSLMNHLEELRLLDQLSIPMDNLIYENVLKDFADRLKEGFFIIPSSVHEVIMIPESWIEDPAELGFMVREVNEKAVPSDEILSDSVYHYDMEKNCLELAVCA